MPGYSGTPLAKKLGIKEGSRVALVDVPHAVADEIHEPLSSCQIAKRFDRALDFIFFFAHSQRELERKLQRVAAALAAAGMLWISWPKKSSGVPSDLTEDIVRKHGLRAGLVDIKVCAITDVWSGLKFVIPVSRREGRSR